MGSIDILLNIQKHFWNAVNLIDSEMIWILVEQQDSVKFSFRADYWFSRL